MFNDHQFLQMKITHKATQLVLCIKTPMGNSAKFWSIQVSRLDTKYFILRKSQRFDFIHRINRNSNKMFVAARVSKFFFKSSLEESLKPYGPAFNSAANAEE